MTNEPSIYGFDPAKPGSDRTVKQLRMGGQLVELLDWNELSRRGLLERINREILHPLGLAACRDVESGKSPGALVSPDGAWSYVDSAALLDSLQRGIERGSLSLQRVEIDRFGNECLTDITIDDIRTDLAGDERGRSDERNG